MNTSKAIVFDCGGVLANDVPNDVFALLSKSYPPEHQSRITMTFKSKYVEAG